VCSVNFRQVSRHGVAKPGKLKLDMRYRSHKTRAKINLYCYIRLVHYTCVGAKLLLNVNKNNERSFCWLFVAFVDYKKESSEKLFCLFSFKKFTLSHSVLYSPKQRS
jgi:hypothetical protein